RPGLRVSTGVIDSNFVFERIVIGPCETLDEMHLLRMREAFGFDPRTVVEPRRIDYQRVAFPVSDRVSRIGRIQILRMPAAIHIDNAKTVWPSDIKDKNPLQFARFDDLETVRGAHLARPGRRFASRKRRIPLETGLAIFV